VRVDEHGQPQAARQRHRAVARGIVHQEDVLAKLWRDFVERAFERFFGVVGRQDDDDFGFFEFQGGLYFLTAWTTNW
jgi:hypothetical protein